MADEEKVKTPIFSMREYLCRSPKDGLGKKFIVLDGPDWVQILAVTPDKRALVVRQFRQGIREVTVELPGGVVEKGQTPLEAAQRELEEETGYQAEQWSCLASFRPNPAIQKNTTHLFLAQGARLLGPTNFDENEDLELEEIPLEQLRDLVLGGKMDHAIMAAAVLYYFAKGEVQL